MPDNPDALYLIRKRGAFYRPNAEGYTMNRAEAGRYTLAQAIWHSHPNGPDGPRDGVDYIPADAIADAGKAIGPEALAPFLAVAANIAARPEDYGKDRLLASGGLANPADLYPAHFRELAAAFRLAPMSHRCETCGVKDGHAEGCAENVPPEPTPLEALKRLVFDLDELAANSEGVTGLHKNGDVAAWSDIGEEGQFGAWLGEALADARAVIDRTDGEA